MCVCVCVCVCVLFPPGFLFAFLKILHFPTFVLHILFFRTPPIPPFSPNPPSLIFFEEVVY